MFKGFAGRFHQNGHIELKEEEEKLYRLPPMSISKTIPLHIQVFENFTTKGPHDTEIVHTGPAGDLELELRHPGLLAPQRGTNGIFTLSPFHDNAWRLLVRRLRRTPDPSAPNVARGYRISLAYPSQLPVLGRRIPVGFFHQNFELNYNQQQYINVRLVSKRIELSFTEDFASLYDLGPTNIDISPAAFVDEVAMTSLRLDVGAGPVPVIGGDGVFFSVRAEFPKVKIKVDVPHFIDPNLVLPRFHITARFYLVAGNNSVGYIPEVESNLLDLLDFNVGIPNLDGSIHTTNVKQFVKKKIERKLAESIKLPNLAPWLVGGRRELLTLDYAPGPTDQRNPNGGIIQRASGDLLVDFVGPVARPSNGPVLKLPGDLPPKDDGSIRLFNLPDEEPDPVPGGSEGIDPGGVTSVGNGSPIVTNTGIGALAKIDHIVVLMQENRSFDQVLGYLSRDKINPNVNGLLPLTDPAHKEQVNRFRGRNFFPQKADKTEPQRLPQLGNEHPGATAWPSFSTPGPCHETDCVLSQMEPNPEAPNIPMGNFVSSYAKRIKAEDPTHPFNAAHLRLVMDYFGPDDLKVYAVLAREFGICDSWYTAHAGPTWPNRFVLLTGDLNLDQFDNVETDNPDVKTMVPLQSRTLFDILNEHGASWRVFEHGYSFLRLFGDFTFDTTNIVQFDDPVRGFEAAARNGHLPQVTLIEPDYIDLPPGNDDHPPADMKFGQDYVNRIVRALIASPAWERTLFIITYDEHGGFYDHKLPPNDAPPLRGGRRKLGPRVPTFVISPHVERSSVFHTRFDHTSIIATILRRFVGARAPHVNPRVDKANDLREVLTANPIRTDFASLGLPPLLDKQSEVERNKLRGKRGSIGKPEFQKEDFHWLLSAMRMTTGEAPQVASKRILQSKIVSGQLLFHRDKLRDGTGQVAAPSVIGSGGWHGFKSLFAGGNGVIYAVDQNGKLLIYRDTTQDGTGDVANPTVAGLNGWQNFKSIFSGDNGIIYAVDQNGRLLFHHDSTLNGIGTVAGPTVIGLGGWQNFTSLFSGGDGIIYAVDQKGRLLFFRDTKQNGTGDVANPTVIGQSGWAKFKFLFSGGNGIIYAVDQKGRLFFYRDTTRNGTGQLANPLVIGASGWQDFKSVFSGGNGVIYGVVA